MASLIKTLAAVPSIFTTAKNFRDNPIIGSPTLNRLGLHSFRVTLADWIFKFRQACLAHLVPTEDRAAFRRDGFILKRDYLAPDLFPKVAAEVMDYEAEGWECHQGDTITHRLLLDETALAKLPAIKQMLDAPAFRGLMKWTGGKNEMPLFYIQRIHNHVLADRPDDPQKVLHSDTFHPTMKAWFFIREVTPETGPFSYAPGTHALTKRRLDWENKRVAEMAAGFKDGYSLKGSLRVLPEKGDMEALGIAGGQSMAVPANTLVVADTHGFHARGHATGEITRIEIWAYSRGNPFNPFVGFETGLMRRIRHYFVRRWLVSQETAATARGKLPAWRRTSTIRT
ncbi:phytanoyl-CoA dioxygenase family protein [Lacibacterium aquatile]|uniref:Phytanoyl-CoA dioxygenase family protein n=1 Tax=Lacibacterium aquatile TaxID=1168082 RepID=A0ABW5DW74_9PROT